MHTFKVSIPQEYDVSFIHNPDLSGEMEIVLYNKQRSGLRLKMAGSAMRKFMEHIQELEDGEDPTTEIEMLRQENADLWNDLRIGQAAGRLRDADHSCEDSLSWVPCPGCAVDKKRAALYRELRMGSKMSNERYQWMMQDPLKDE